MLNILSSTMAIATRTDRKDAVPARPRNYVYSIAEKRRMAEAERDAGPVERPRSLG